MNSTKLVGIIPVLITPLNEDKSIDVCALENLCHYFEHEQGVSGIWILGTGAEDMCLSYDQRILVADVVSRSLSSNVIKIVGCSFYSPKESMSFIRSTSHMAFDAYHAMPYHLKVSQRQLLSWYSLLASHCEKPLWAYTSGNWAQPMSPDFISRVKEIPNVAGVKYSSSNIVDVQGAIELEDDNFQVITAVVKTLYSSLCLGTNAVTSVEASVFTPEIKQIFELYGAGKLDSALEAQRTLNNTFLRYPSVAAKDNFLKVAELKYLLSLQGKCKPFVTEYYRELTDIEMKDLSDWYIEHLLPRR